MEAQQAARALQVLAAGAAERPRRRRRVDVPEAPPAVDLTRLEQLTGRLDALIQQANELQALYDQQSQLDTGDARVIYSQYEQVKQQLVDELRQIQILKEELDSRVPANAVDEQRLAEIERELTQRIDGLQGILTKLRDQFMSAKQQRRQLGLPVDQAITDDTISDYYGVYVFNLVRDAMAKMIAEWRSRDENEPPIDIGTLQDLKDQLSAAALSVAVREQQKQQAYLDTINPLVEEQKNQVLGEEEKTRWEQEIQVIQERLRDPGGTILKAAGLANDAVQREQANTLMELRKKFIKYPVGALEQPAYVLSGTANQRMFENDIIPGQLPAGSARVIPEEIAGMRGTAQIATIEQRLAGDIAWRSVSVEAKTRLLDRASQWADAGGVEAADDIQGKMLRLLQGVAAKLGVQFANFEEEGTRELVRTWNDDVMIEQMRAACSDRNEAKMPQKVIQEPTWRQLIIDSIRNNIDFSPGMHGWFLLDSNDDKKLYGIVSGRDSRYYNGANDEENMRQDLQSKFVTTEIGRQQGVPDIVNLSKSYVDLTYVCAQHEEEARIGNNMYDYRIGGKRPVHLGALMILWLMVSLLDEGYHGILLEVVGSEGGTRTNDPQDVEIVEGYSRGKANTDVASGYQRYYKFQRTNDVRYFAPTAALATFHPGWQAYQAQPTVPGVGNLAQEIMYRPYPTQADLFDMIARLISKVIRDYEIRD